MKRYTLLAVLLAVFNGGAFAGRCEIIVHEKTPDCYVKQGEDGCLEIGNVKPECDDKGECVAKLPGCDETRQY